MRLDESLPAWQILFDKETELWKGWRKKKDLGKFKGVVGENNGLLPHGQLSLNCNDPDVILRYDKRCPDGRFTWEETPLVHSALQVCTSNSKLKFEQR